jgi:hypothetical protein
MTDCKRHGKRWTTSEVLNLQREYELLNWSVQDIAAKHQRSVDSILYKLHAEGLTPSLLELKVAVYSAYPLQPGQLQVLPWGFGRSPSLTLMLLALLLQAQGIL